ncbi:MAG TPA: N-acetylmuramoyl-L-alanine amidase-like domain-containing protein [Myxococcota bacterium]|jgi:hypothetical protein|nr:N-acetylmuramoyl-L-alanine amidase-like domain-containing protein [Myxococcota bacterium]
MRTRRVVWLRRPRGLLLSLLGLGLALAAAAAAPVAPTAAAAAPAAGAAPAAAAASAAAAAAAPASAAAPAAAPVGAARTPATFVVPAELRDLDAFLTGVAAIPGLPARLEAASRPFLGVPYKLDALGEGPGAPDADPLWDFTRCDCQTLVEEVLALTFSHDRAEFEARMRALRYVGGAVAYEARRHLVEPRWLPGLVAEGYLREVTPDVGGAATATATLVVDDRPLAPKFEKLRKKVGGAWPAGTYALRYVPIDVAIARHAAIPAGTVLLPVRAPVPDSPFLVSHMGLVLVRDGKRLFRHASSSPIFKKVVEQSLPGYLGFLKRYFADKDRPVIGVAVYEVTDPGPLRPTTTAAPPATTHGTP